MTGPHHNIFPNGFRYEVHKTVTATDVHLWAGLTGNPPPVRSAAAFAQQRVLEHSIAPAAYLTGLAADTVTRLTAHLPPPGAILEALRVHLTASVPVGATLCIAVTVTAWDATAGLFWLDIHATRADGMLAMLGTAWLRPRATLLPAG